MTQNNELIINGGTTVIAAITNDRIIVAADSKHVAKYSESDKIKETVSVCKIHITNNTCYAFAGNIDIYQNGIRIFDCNEIMEEVLSKDLQFESIISEFSQNLATKLIEVNNKIGFIPTDTSKNLPFISVILTAFNERPLFKCINYYIRYNEHKQIFLDIKDVTSKSIPIMHMIGWTIDIDEYLAQHPDYLKDINDLEKKLPFLIDLESKARPSEVGPPINMIKMTNGGWSWIIRNEECQ